VSVFASKQFIKVKCREFSLISETVPKNYKKQSSIAVNVTTALLLTGRSSFRISSRYSESKSSSNSSRKAFANVACSQCLKSGIYIFVRILSIFTAANKTSRDGIPLPSDDTFCRPHRKEILLSKCWKPCSTPDKLLGDKLVNLFADEWSFECLKEAFHNYFNVPNQLVNQMARKLNSSY